MTAPELDLTARYAVEGYPGVAFRVIGPKWETVEVPPTCEHEDPEDHDEFCDLDQTEEVPSEEWVRVMMVGDDTPYDVERSELTVLAEDASCAECGQVGCTADGRS